VADTAERGNDGEHTDGSSTRALGPANRGRAMNGPLLAGLSPWLVFVVVARSGDEHLTTAALVALAWSAALVVRSVSRGRRPVLELGAAGLFGALALAGGLLAPGWTHAVSPFGRAVALGFLALGTFASLGTRPVTEHYTRDRVPDSELGTGAFRGANVALTAGWSAASAALAASFSAGALLPGFFTTTVFNWLLPLLVVLACIHYTERRWCETLDDRQGEWAILDAALASPLSRPPAGDPAGHRRARLRSVPPPATDEG
jgi:hypothetical protein